VANLAAAVVGSCHSRNRVAGACHERLPDGQIACELRSFARNNDLGAVGATKQPDGQITKKYVQPLSKKYSAFTVGQISD
jgi:hypothetical protein